MTALADLRRTLEEAAAAVAPSRPFSHQGGAPAAPTLARPPRPEFGDYSTNVALLLAPGVGEPPRKVAERVAEMLEARLGASVSRVEVAGPGFLNIFLSTAWLTGSLAGVLAEGASFGGAGAEPSQRINVEFVSANPTGPLTVAHGRHAAYGDSLARILTFHGHAVQREYYVNDHGSQVRRLGESMRARARGEPVPEGGYQGDYVTELLDASQAAHLDVEELSRIGVAVCLRQIQETLAIFRVAFDIWSRESALHELGHADADLVRRALAELQAAGAVYRADGAMWLASTRWGDDKDRVLQRSSGEQTYFASDIAYHELKRSRNYDLLIDVLGADHHGYVARLQAAWQALGGDSAALQVVIMQFVHVLARGARTSMSKRRGEFITLEDLIVEIGTDAARFFLVSRSHDTTVDLDLDLARAQSNDNPVYYVQYAHARIASMLTRSGDQRVSEALDAVASLVDLGAEPHPAERGLLKKLLAFPAEVAEAAERRAPHRIGAYALELAQEFTAFYRDCRVVGAQPEALESWRIALSRATQRTLARSLDLLGVSAPEAM